MSISKQFNDSVIEKLKKLDKALNDLLELTGIEMVEEVRQLMQDNNNYDSGRLSELTNKQVKDNILTFGSNASSNGFNYGLAQEYGRKPGTWPNFDALYDWVARKVQLGHMTLEKSLGKNLNDRIGQVTYLIAAKIKAKGSKGKFFYKKAFELGNEFFLSRFDDVMKGVFA